MEIIIVRHAESEQQTKSVTGGWSNTDITERGMTQAELTGRKLQRLIDEDYLFLSSDLLRARKTSEIIGKFVGQSANYYEELRELNNGDAANKAITEADRIRNAITYPTIDWIPFPNAESWRMMQIRIWGFLDNTILPNCNYMVVSHGNAMIEIINWFLNLYYEDKNLSYEIDNCSITILGENEWNERTIRKLNDTSHLDDR